MAQYLDISRNVPEKVFTDLTNVTPFLYASSSKPDATGDEEELGLPMLMEVDGSDLNSSFHCTDRDYYFNDYLPQCSTTSHRSPKPTEQSASSKTNERNLPVLKCCWASHYAFLEKSVEEKCKRLTIFKHVLIKQELTATLLRFDSDLEDNDTHNDLSSETDLCHCSQYHNQEEDSSWSGSLFA